MPCLALESDQLTNNEKKLIQNELRDIIKENGKLDSCKNKTLYKFK